MSKLSQRQLFHSLTAVGPKYCLIVMRELSVLIEKTSGAVSGTAMMFNGGAGAGLLIFPELAAKVVGTGALSRVIGKLFGGRIPRIYLLVIVLAAINLANAAELDGRIRLTGSSTIAPLVLEIARRFTDLQYSGAATMQAPSLK